MRVWVSGVKTYVDPILPGDLVFGAGVARVIESTSQKLPVGTRVTGYIYWSTL